MPLGAARTCSVPVSGGAKERLKRRNRQMPARADCLIADAPQEAGLRVRKSIGRGRSTRSVCVAHMSLPGSPCPTLDLDQRDPSRAGEHWWVCHRLKGLDMRHPARRNPARTRHLLQAMPGVVAVLQGADNLVEYANAAFLKLTGLQAVEVLGRPAATVIPESAELLAQLARDVRTAGEAIQLRGARVQQLVLDITCSPVSDAEGAFSSVLLQAWDVTDRTGEINTLTLEDGRKDTFMATLAHELRGPLSAISAAASFLERRPECRNPELQKCSAMLSRETNTASRLIDDLNDLAAIRLGKVRLELQEHVILQTLVRDAADSLQHQIRSKRQRIYMAVPARPVLVDVDPTKIKRVVCNILNNASKYTPSGGRVEVKLQVRKDDCEAVLDVSDDGCGMDPETLARVFEPYYQGERASSGLGVGLALAREVVSQHGGRIAAESSGLGRGSSFSIRLPLADSRSGRLSPYDEDRAPDGTPLEHYAG